jgi:hypothetical protein
LKGSQVFRASPYYVAKVVCGLYLNTLRKLHRHWKLYHAVVVVGLKLKEQIEKPYVCPICRKGARDGERPFKDKRGLFIHLTRKHYGDLIKMVEEAYNCVKHPRRAMRAGLCE